MSQQFDLSKAHSKFRYTEIFDRMLAKHPELVSKKNFGVQVAKMAALQCKKHAEMNEILNMVDKILATCNNINANTLRPSDNPPSSVQAIKSAGFNAGNSEQLNPYGLDRSSLEQHMFGSASQEKYVDCQQENPNPNHACQTPPDQT